MNNNGLNISEEQFMSMKTKEQNLMLFRNLVHIRKQLKDYKVHRKIQYAWMSALTAIIAMAFGFSNWGGLLGK